MPKFNVHLFPVIRVLVNNVEAETKIQAIEKALTCLNDGYLEYLIKTEMHYATGEMGVSSITDAESCPDATVDVQGDEDFSNTEHFHFDTTGEDFSNTEHFHFDTTEMELYGVWVSDNEKTKTKKD